MHSNSDTQIPKNVDLPLDLGISLGFWYFETHHSPLPNPDPPRLERRVSRHPAGLGGFANAWHSFDAARRPPSGVLGIWNKEYIVGNHQQCSGTPSKQDQLYMIHLINLMYSNLTTNFKHL